MKTIPGHKIESKRLDDWEADYGGSSRPVKNPWVICECGFKQQIFERGSDEQTQAQHYINQHYIDVLVNEVFGEQQ